MPAQAAKTYRRHVRDALRLRLRADRLRLPVSDTHTSQAWGAAFRKRTASSPLSAYIAKVGVRETTDERLRTTVPLLGWDNNMGFFIAFCFLVILAAMLWIRKHVR